MLAAVLAAALLLLPAADAAALELPDGLDDRELTGLLRQLDDEYADYLSGFSLESAWQRALQGEIDWWSLLPELLTELAVGQVKAQSRLLLRLLALALLSMVLSLLGRSLGKDSSLPQLCSWLVSLSLLTAVMTSFGSSLQLARQTLDAISDLLFILLPLLLPLLASLGGISTTLTLSPLLLFALDLLMGLLKNVIFPLIWCQAVLSLARQLAPSFDLSRLAALCKDAAVGLMGVSGTLFMSVLGLSGFTAAGRDGLTFKAAKSLTGAFIPLVGRTLADSLDSVLSTLALLKGALGLVGGLALLFICARPALSLLVQSLLFKLAGAVAQPLGEESLSAALSGLGQSLTLLFAAVALAGLFAFFALALTVALGSVTLMMR